MRKFIVAVALVLMVAAPIAAVELYDFGGVKITSSASFWVTPHEARNTFWGMPDFPQPPVCGYVTDVEVVYLKDIGDDSIYIQMDGMNNIFGDVFTPPLPRYGEKTRVPWNDEFSAYGWTEVTDKGLEFEFFVFIAEGGVFIGKWVTGCLTANAGLFPPWSENTQCIWSEWDLGEIPEWRKHIRRNVQRRK